jgi:hypothetical protein
VATQEELTIVAELIDKLSPELKKIRGQIDKTEAKTKRSFDAMKLAANGFRGALSRVGGALKIAGAAAAAFGTVATISMSKTAAEAEAVRGKFSVVFGELAEQSGAAAAAIAASFGRAETDVLRFFATFQDTFVPFGFARAEAASLSEQVTKLAIDLASFNDVADDQALEDLQSALVGNVETMRKYGVVINQTVLDQELLRMGVEGGVAAATEQEKVLARLNLIFAGTADAQGDAIRTADEFNNSMKRMAAEVTSVQERFGAFINEDILAAVDRIGGSDGVNDLLTTLGALLAEVAEAVLEVGSAFAQMGVDMINALGGAEVLAAKIGLAWDDAKISVLEFQQTLRETDLAIRETSAAVRGKLGLDVDAGSLHQLRMQTKVMGSIIDAARKSIELRKDEIRELEAHSRKTGDLNLTLEDYRERQRTANDETKRSASALKEQANAARQAKSAFEEAMGAMGEMNLAETGGSSEGAGEPNLADTGGESQGAGDQPSFATGYEKYVAPKKQSPAAMAFKMGQFAYTKGVEGIQKYREELRRLEIQQMKMAAANMLASTFADIVSGAKKASDAIKDLASSLLGMFAQAAAQKAFGQILGIGGASAFANGGIVPGGGLSGAVPVKGYANGGPVFKGPHIGIIGEGRYNEAAVPLPDGKRIPVDLRGAGEGMGSTNVTFNVSAVDAESVASLFARNGQELADVVMARFQRDPNTRGMVMGGMA